MMAEREWFAVIAPERMIYWLRERTTERKLGPFAVAVAGGSAICAQRWSCTMPLLPQSDVRG